MNIIPFWQSLWESYPTKTVGKHYPLKIFQSIIQMISLKLYYLMIWWTDMIKNKVENSQVKKQIILREYPTLLDRIPLKLKFLTITVTYDTWPNDPLPNNPWPVNILPWLISHGMTWSHFGGGWCPSKKIAEH